MPNSVRQQTDITDEEKQIVLKRQNYKSISGVWLGTNIHNCDFHHCINSGLGIKGVGFEWNLVAITRQEHMAIHNHDKKIGRYTYDEFITLIKNHLKLNYINWCEEKCKVKKGYTKEDYEILPRNK